MRTFIQVKVLGKQLAPGRQWGEGLAHPFDEERWSRASHGL
jgi:hypothetical protein